jgi:hypothetical protein
MDLLQGLEPAFSALRVVFHSLLTHFDKVQALRSCVHARDVRAAMVIL